FSRRKHGKRPVPFSAWELPEQAIAWCLAEGGLTVDDLDAVAYSYDPALVDPDSGGPAPTGEYLRTTDATPPPRIRRQAFPFRPAPCRARRIRCAGGALGSGRHARRLRRAGSRRPWRV